VCSVFFIVCVVLCVVFYFVMYVICVLCLIVYKTIILPMVLYGCETWSLTLREEHILRVFENRVLRRIFGPRRDEVTA
jgi:hypothetical protein